MYFTELLLEHGATLNTVDSDQNSVLHHSCINVSPTTCSLFYMPSNNQTLSKCGTAMKAKTMSSLLENRHPLIKDMVIVQILVKYHLIIILVLDTSEI